jgi:hypothetical protein
MNVHKTNVRPKGSLSKTFGRYFAEIVIIFIGITISFIFEEWREEKANRQQEREFIESLLGDLKFKKDEISAERNEILQFIQYSDSALLIFEDHKIISDGAIFYLLNSYNLDNNFFNSSTPTFNANVGTEQYHRLPDTLRREMFGVYSLFDYLKLYFESVDKVRFNFKQNQMASSGILYDAGVVLDNGVDNKKTNYAKIRSFINSNEFRNNLRLIRNYEVDKTAILNNADNRIDELAANLKRYHQAIR